MVWVGMANEMNPTEWGWKQENDQLIPIMTQNNAAPDELLKSIHCNCSGGMQILSMQLLKLWTPLHCSILALAKPKTVTIQTTLKRSILRRRMTLKAERPETCFMDKGVCALGDSGQLKVMSSIS